MPFQICPEKFGGPALSGLLLSTKEEVKLRDSLRVTLGKPQFCVFQGDFCHISLENHIICLQRQNLKMSFLKTCNSLGYNLHHIILCLIHLDKCLCILRFRSGVQLGHGKAVEGGNFTILVRFLVDAEERLQLQQFYSIQRTVYCMVH